MMTVRNDDRCIRMPLRVYGLGLYHEEWSLKLHIGIFCVRTHEICTFLLMSTAGQTQVEAGT